LEAANYRATLSEHPVAAPVDLETLRDAFGGMLPSDPTPPGVVLEELIKAAEGGLVATNGPRFFGFVIGGSLPAATAADVVASGWDQCAFNAVLAPAAVIAEESAGAWLKDLLGIPATASVGFVTGGQAANTVGLAAARHHVLAEAGWDVERNGLHSAPRVRVVASAERHSTIDRSLRLLGFGTALVEPIATDANGTIDVDDLERVLAAGPTAPTIVSLQAGSVNTGACDDLRAACGTAHRHGAWAHVDGAFGLWAAASPALRGAMAGIEDADSWVTDGHKWLNTPYDCGLAIVRDAQALHQVMTAQAPYLAAGTAAAPKDMGPEFSRSARAVEVWAALYSLGRQGLADLIDRTCAHARAFADGLRGLGYTVLNDVTLNQVVAAPPGDPNAAGRIAARVQESGECWFGPTIWRGRPAIRISVSSHATTTDDVRRSLEAIAAATEAEQLKP